LHHHKQWRQVVLKCPQHHNSYYYLQSKSLRPAHR
jgi:hypothetical protein